MKKILTAIAMTVAIATSAFADDFKEFYTNGYLAMVSKIKASPMTVFNDYKKEMKDFQNGFESGSQGKAVLENYERIAGFVLREEIAEYILDEIKTGEYGVHPQIEKAINKVLKKKAAVSFLMNNEMVVYFFPTKNIGDDLLYTIIMAKIKIVE